VRGDVTASWGLDIRKIRGYQNNRGSIPQLQSNRTLFYKEWAKTHSLTHYNSVTVHCWEGSGLPYYTSANRALEKIQSEPATDERFRATRLL